jgi:hypothetical protein
MADPTQGLPAYAQPPLGLNAANAMADQQYMRAVAPGPGALAAVRGIGPNGFPVAQPGQGGTVAGLWNQALNSNGAQAGIPQPQPVGARMMGTADPLAGYPGFTNGTGSPAGFSPAGAINAVQPVSAQPLNTAALNAATGPAFAPSAARLARAGYGADGGSSPNELPAGTSAGSTDVSPTPGAGNPLPPGMGGGATAGLPAYSAVAAGQAQYDARQPAYAPGGLQNPMAAASAGFDRQEANTRNFMGQALDYVQGGNGIFEQATRGRAIGNILHAVMGPNNAGQVYGQGADSFNQSTASEADAGMTSGASMFDAQQRLAGEQARVAEEHYKDATDSVPLGTVVGTDPVTHMAVPLTTYGRRSQQAGGMPAAYNATTPAARPKEGDSGKTPEGTPTVYRNGTWVAR